MSDIVERLRGSCEFGIDPDTVYEAADEIERLRAENAALQDDAERYRFWKYNGFAYYADRQMWRLTDRSGVVLARGNADNIDAAIDAARKG